MKLTNRDSQVSRGGPKLSAKPSILALTRETSPLDSIHSSALSIFDDVGVAIYGKRTVYHFIRSIHTTKNWRAYKFGRKYMPHGLVALLWNRAGNGHSIMMAHGVG
jgi:hypothetical protein